MRVSGLNQVVTKWTAVDDGFGGYTYTAPQLVMARWEEKGELFRDRNGEEKVSQAIVYLDSASAVGDWLYLGDASGNASPPDGSFEVQAYHKSPDLRSASNFHKAYL